MVVRFWRGRAAVDRAGLYRNHFNADVLPKLQRIDGFLAAHLLERRLDDRVEFLVMTEWQSWDAIRQFAGDNPGRAVVALDAQQMLLDYDDTVEHFERGSS